MPYHQYHITLSPSHAEAVAERLFALGSLGLSEQEGSLTAYFPETADPEHLRRELELMASLLQRLTPPVRLTFRYTSLPDRDWNAAWKQAFTPLEVGERFLVLPPWEPQTSARIPLIIDPGMAFGTGHHETTRSCLVLMERFSNEVKRETFLDVGTGTGLLAIAALKLGFKTVVAVDTDPLAIEAAGKNIMLNDRQGIELVEGGIEAAGGTYDMITANLISGTLIEMAGELSARLGQGGVVIMSGILKGQESEVAAAARKAGLIDLAVLPDGKWMTLACRHHASG